MFEFIKYSLQDYIRSQKYFAPISTYIIIIFVFYTYTPNPIIDSYAVTALILFVISAWLCVSFLSLDSTVQKQIIILRLKSNTRYFVGKLLSIWLVTVVLTVYAFLYPILFQMFREPVNFTLGFVAILNHMVLAILGISVASIFSREVIKSPISAYGGLALCLTISISALGIYDVLPSIFKNIVWIIPPAISTQSSLMEWSGTSITQLSIFSFVWIVIYSLLVLLLFLKLSRR
ncbi:hypothetical protein [Oceanobacillus bengalensis]|uniref:Uncharacterized protein n=1 Tax=Oceanobacillus bengalensis TaxID=1435466 RepID=A0A494Z6L5_9BACI|nr:hypothetical protein [Oceanobacillus bengalensis]RKQ17637.1 hypothetical protein D8M05_04360 [Oceanobacillus bengalensis]